MCVTAPFNKICYNHTHNIMPWTSKASETKRKIEQEGKSGLEKPKYRIKRNICVYVIETKLLYYLSDINSNNNNKGKRNIIDNNDNNINDSTNNNSNIWNIKMMWTSNWQATGTVIKQRKIVMCVYPFSIKLI